MTDFTASNGITIREREDSMMPVLEWNADGRDCTDGSRWYAVGEGINGADPGFTADSPVARALRELWQRERDEEQGVWRSLKDHTWTAVRRNNTIYFQNGDHERSFWFIVGNEATLKPWSGALQAIAREYLQAHPERKPWHAPDAGDHWALHIAHGMALSGDEHLYKYTRWGSQGRWGFVPTDGGSVLDPTDPTITAGRRIWPEDAS